MDIGKFEDEWESFKKNYEHDSFDYNDSSTSISKVIKSHFGDTNKHKKYGVYIIRQKATYEVLYIGKAGTIDKDGKFKRQDIPVRLKNNKGKDSSDQWFESLVKEKGALVIEYIVLTSTPKSPAFVEAYLLQTYLNEYRCLPYRNKEF